MRKKIEAILVVICLAIGANACGEAVTAETTNKMTQDDICVVKDGVYQETAKESGVIIEGLPFLEQNKGKLVRYDMSFASDLSDDIKKWGSYSAGACVVFKTNAREISATIEISDPYILQWHPITATSGIDVYSKYNDETSWEGQFFPEDIDDNTIEVALDNEAGCDKQYYIYLPQYVETKNINIKVEESAQFFDIEKHETSDPIVFYGSSITNGVAAERFGTTYPAQVGRFFDAEIVNCGFDGSAKGEPEVAEMLANIPMSAIVIEYDHNADSIEDLRETYERFYSIIRNNNPEIPIVLLSRLSGGLSIDEDEAEGRCAVIEDVYRQAVSRGEKTYYINGDALLPKDATRSDYFVDGKHPNDRGMAVIAQIIIDTLEEEL